MWKHVRNDHEGNVDNVKFNFKVTGNFRRPIWRQIDEAYRIEQSRGNGNLNSRKEYNGQSLKRIVIENPDKMECYLCDYVASNRE